MAIKDWHSYEDMRADLMLWIVVLLIGWLCGWIHAHRTVATECERLGKFYVGKNTYECHLIKATSD